MPRPHRPTSLRDGDGARVAEGRDEDRRGGDEQAGRQRSHRPGRGLRPARAEPRRSERELPGERRPTEPEDRAEDPDEHRLTHRQPHDPPRRGASDPQQSLLLAPAVSTRGRDHRGEQRREDRSRDAEEQEQQLRIQRVAAGRVELGAEVVAHGPAAGEPGLEVLCGGQDLGECRGGIRWQRGGIEGHVQLLVGGPGWRRGEVPDPLGRGQQNNVVGRRLQPRPRGQPHYLEQGVRLREVHDPGDADAHRGGPGSQDRDDGADRRVEVRRGLLRDQDAGACPDQEPDLAGECRGVPVGQAEDLPAPGRLHRAGRCRPESGGVREVERQHPAHTGGGPHHPPLSAHG